MDERGLGLAIAVAGAVLIGVGLLVALGAFGWFGRLPGDLRFGNDNVRVYAPLVSMILISVVLTLLLNAVRRFF